jgi:hypothetical protein
MDGVITAWWLGRPEKLSGDTISVVAVSMLASQIRIDGILWTTARGTDRHLVRLLRYASGLAPAEAQQMGRLVMKPQPGPSTREVLAGLVERVTYHYEETGPHGRKGQ